MKAFHQDERGSLTMVNTAAVLASTLIVIFMINVSHVVDEKIEVQNAADGAAVSAATVMARGMNAVTGTNHVIGEMIGMVIVHHGYGGHNLDDNRVGDTRDEDRKLDRRYRGYRRAGGRSAPAYPTVRQRSGVRASEDSAELDSKVVLKEALAEVYRLKTRAMYMMRNPNPGVRAAGRILHFLQDIQERRILVEYQQLDALHEVARSLTPLKQLLRDGLAPEAKRFTHDVVRETPRLALRTAQEVAAIGRCAGTVFPNPPQLPVVIDPHARASSLRATRDAAPEPCASCQSCGSERVGIGRLQIVKITQLARASFPWVTYHRKPILDFMGPMFPISRAKKHYKDATDGAGKRVCDEVQTGWQDLGLYVVADEAAPDKGYAAWTEDPDHADALFSIIGVAQRGRPKAYGGGVYRQAHPDGRVAYAQALVYNANAQVRPAHRIDLRCKRITPNRQARVGYDTLNWSPDAPRPPELVAKMDNGGAPPTAFPEVKLNWQAKLVPGSDARVSQMVADAGTLPAPIAAVVRRMTERLPPAFQTH